MEDGYLGSKIWEEPTLPELGRELASARTKLRMSQEVLAKRIGKSRAWVGQVENDVFVPKEHDLLLLAANLNMEASYLLEQAGVPATSGPVLVLSEAEIERLISRGAAHAVEDALRGALMAAIDELSRQSAPAEVVERAKARSTQSPARRRAP